MTLEDELKRFLEHTKTREFTSTEHRSGYFEGWILFSPEVSSETRKAMFEWLNDGKTTETE